ncbi:MAG: hypothetical protein BWK80_09890 [Desulfobacteraceae bacterium IS3]|nr:MAG: hypothetical protein BWK80_09890 [Desulfobacteraceae bacterium IS3]
MRFDMPVYTYIDACQNLDKLMDEARQRSEVIIKTRNGDLFTLRFVPKKKLLSDLPDNDIALTRDEIISYIREVRER